MLKFRDSCTDGTKIENEIKCTKKMAKLFIHCELSVLFVCFFWGGWGDLLACTFIIVFGKHDEKKYNGLYS